MRHHDLHSFQRAAPRRAAAAASAHDEAGAGTDQEVDDSCARPRAQRVKFCLGGKLKSVCRVVRNGNYPATQLNLSMRVSRRACYTLLTFLGHLVDRVLVVRVGECSE